MTWIAYKRAALLAFPLSAGMGAFMHASPAYACSCAEEYISIPQQPYAGSTDQPINLNFVSAGVEGETTYLRADDGTEIAINWRFVTGVRVGVSLGVPETELAANTHYEMRSDYGVFQDFTTGSWRAEPPDAPHERDRSAKFKRGRRNQSSSCQSTKDTAYNYIEIRDPNLVLLAALDPEPLRDGLPQGAVTTMTNGHGVFIGKSFCIHTWPEATRGASSPLYMGTVDEYGQFSGWEQMDDVKIPSCGVNPDSDGNALLLGLVPLLWWQRRRG